MNSHLGLMRQPFYSDRSSCERQYLCVPISGPNLSSLSMVSPLPTEKSRDGLRGRGKTWDGEAVLRERSWCELDWSWGGGASGWHFPCVGNPAELAAPWSSMCRSPVLVVWLASQLHTWGGPESLWLTRGSAPCKDPWSVLWDPTWPDQASAWPFLPDMSLLGESLLPLLALAPDFRLFRAALDYSLSVLSLFFVSQ